jgi:hypothetical protein
MNSTIMYNIRQLTDEEIRRLERALGKPVERAYLVYWISTGIRDLVKLSTPIVSPREYRDELEEIVQQGRKWVETLKQSRSTSLLPNVLEIEQLISSVATFSDAVESLAEQSDKSVGPGRAHTNLALEAFLDRLIGIAKRVKVRPRTPSRAMVRPINPDPGPPFYEFVTEALDIAEEVTKSSPLAQNQMDAALAVLRAPTDQALIKVLERLRGRAGEYRDSTVGLVEWDLAEGAEPNRPEDSETSSD